MIKYTSLLLITIIGVSCSPKLSPDYTWARQRWVVTEMKAVPVQQSGGRRDAFLNFNITDKTFTGNGGCNQLNGSYTIDKNEISFGEVISTKMSCEDIAFENTFLDLLRQVDRFEQQDDRLLLKRKRETVLVLNARAL